MSLNRVADQQHAAAGTPSVATTQIGRMRAAIDAVVAAGPRFLHGDVDADHMANTMVHSVNSYVEQERATDSHGVPQGAEARELEGVLRELMACGSGYLAGRCDAACVARTITQVVHEFRAA